MANERNSKGKLIWSILLLASTKAYASGNYNPAFGATMSADFNLGKSIVYGKTKAPGCISCHKQFNRKDVKDNFSTMSQMLSQESLSHPPFERLYSAKEATALLEYFKVRYGIN